MYPIAIYYRKTDVEMVFHFEKFCDLLWEKIVDVIKKNFLDTCLKADNLQNKNNSLNINRIPYARHYNPLLIRNPLLNTNHTKAPWKNVFGLQKVGKKYTNRGL